MEKKHSINRKVKCCVFGSPGIGRRDFIHLYLSHFYPEYHPSNKQFLNTRQEDPFPFVTLSVSVPHEGGHAEGEQPLEMTQTVNLDVWYIKYGGEDYERLRALSYPNTDVFILCFSVVKPASFEDVRKLWFPQVFQHLPDIPILLVGLQAEMRSDPHTLQQLQTQNLSPITYEDGQKLKESLNLYGYYEVNSSGTAADIPACTTHNLIFEEAIKSLKTPRYNNKTKTSRCCIC